MPTYIYRRKDGSTFEIQQKITEDSLKVCPTTKQPVERLIAGGSFQLKGTGWYKTDYASPGTGNSSKSKSSDSSESSSTNSDSSNAVSKSETKSEAKIDKSNDSKQATS